MAKLDNHKSSSELRLVDWPLCAGGHRDRQLPVSAVQPGKSSRPVGYASKHR